MSFDQQINQTPFDYNVFHATTRPLAQITSISEVTTSIISAHKVFYIAINLPNLKPGILSNVPRTEQLNIVRRYSDFERFHTLVKATHKDVLLPALPSKFAVNKINRSDPNAIQIRADALELYLNKILTNLELAKFEEFTIFFSKVQLLGNQCFY